VLLKPQDPSLSVVGLYVWVPTVLVTKMRIDIVGPRHVADSDGSCVTGLNIWVTFVQSALI